MTDSVTLLAAGATLRDRLAQYYGVTTPTTWRFYALLPSGF